MLIRTRCNHLGYHSLKLWRKPSPKSIQRKQIHNTNQKQLFAMFFKRGVLKNFCKFHRRTSVLESLFNKCLVTCNFIKKKLQHRCFPMKFAKFLRTAFFIEHFWWLFLIYNGVEPRGLFRTLWSIYDESLYKKVIMVKYLHKISKLDPRPRFISKKPVN